MPEQELDATTYARPLDFHVSDSMESRYATNMVVQHSEHEFIIYFFEVLPPLLLGEPGVIKAKLSDIDSIRAECVARIVIAAERMPGFVRVLQENLEHYAAKKRDASSE